MFVRLRVARSDDSLAIRTRDKRRVRYVLRQVSTNYTLLSVLCFVCRASRYIRVIKTILMLCLSSVYLVNQPLHVSGIFVAHYQDVDCIYTKRTICCIYTVYLVIQSNSCSIHTLKHNHFNI